MFTGLCFVCVVYICQYMYHIYMHRLHFLHWWFCGERERERKSDHRSAGAGKCMIVHARILEGSGR